MKNKIKILYDGIQLQLTDSLTKVFWDERPKAMAEEAAVQALRGECVSFQLAYSFEGWRFGEGRVQSFRFAKVKVESPVLPYLRVRKVMNVPSRYAAHKKNDDNYLRREPGLYPDLLETLEDDCVVFQEDQWNSLWIDLEAPADAAPGTYPGVHYVYGCTGGGRTDTGVCRDRGDGPRSKDAGTEVDSDRVVLCGLSGRLLPCAGILGGALEDY